MYVEENEKKGRRTRDAKSRRDARYFFEGRPCEERRKKDE